MTAYRQIAHRLRLQLPPGRPHIESERPRAKKGGRYLDLDAEGRSTTTIDIPDEAVPNAAQLLKVGAIEPLPAERSAGNAPPGGRAKPDKEAPDGEGPV